MASMKSALQAKEEVRNLLHGLPGINGIGITWDDDGQPCVQVNVDTEMEEANRLKIPSQIMGVPVRVEVTGPIQLE